MAFIVVVTRRALSLEALMKNRPAPDFRDPFALGLGTGFDRTGFVLFRILDDISDVMRLLIKCLREVRGDRVLQRTHVKTIRKAVAEKAVQRFHAISPVVGQCLAAAPVNLQSRATSIGGPDLEPGREDDAIYFVLDALEHDSLLRDALDAFAASIDQGYVGT